MSTAFTEKGLNAAFKMGIETWPALYPRICEVVNSTHQSEKYALAGRPAYPREWIGPRESNRIAEATYELTNQKWEATLQIPNDDIADDTTGMLMTRVREMGAYSNIHRDELVLKTVIDAGTTATCYDGQYFYDTDHTFPEGDYTTSQDNDKTGTAATGTAPTVLEFITSLRTCIEALIAYKDDKGLPINPNVMGSLLLEGPPSYAWLFQQIMKSDLISHTAATAAESNFIKDMFAGFVINAYTGNTGDRYRVHVINGTRKPFLFQNREPLRTQLLLANDAKPNIDSFKHDTNYFGTKARYTAGYYEPLTSCLYVFT
jgi:phage major head subunit gpT-like protein